MDVKSIIYILTTFILYIFFPKFHYIACICGCVCRFYHRTNICVYINEYTYFNSNHSQKQTFTLINFINVNGL